ncbi:cobaltochelatase CobT-related protein [Paraburkholderia sp. J12]|uniref:cobaltochelatase CobT-related protein n=1 Tax=Paraburkholderia sp. J12 TaxID=2805432 RepID=UPI002ABD2B5F|nr:cobalamin biosynthesis protein CobT [Paraburkholderia sp. J12]
MSLSTAGDLEATLGKIARVLTGEPRVSVTIGPGGPRMEKARFVLPSHASDHGDDEDVLLGYLDLLAARFRYSEAVRLDDPKAGVTGRIAQVIEDRRVLERLLGDYPGAQLYVQRWRVQQAQDAARRWTALPWRERLVWTIERSLWGEAPAAVERDAATVAAALRAVDGPLVAARASRSTRESVQAAAAIVAGVRSLASRGANNMMQTARPAEGLDDEAIARELETFGEDDDLSDALLLAASDGKTGERDDTVTGAAGQTLAEALEAAKPTQSGAGATLSEADATHAAQGAAHADSARSPWSRPLTTAFDVVTDLTGQGDATAWRKLRALARAETGSLKTHLERVLKADELTHWKREQERGEIDRAALARLAASRGYRSPFRVSSKASGRDAVVTLLLDLSGSMAGRKIELARLCTAALCDALVQLAFDCEVLGYSSVESPEMRQQYERARAAGLDLRPYNRFVERLDLRVFKRFGARDLSGLAAIECGHENPDGEALAWAAERLLQRKARRRLLFVLSDGYPSTSDGNPAVLHRDLHARIEAVTQAGVELVGIGIQDDAVEAFYPHAVVVRKLHELPLVAFETLSRLLTGRVR